MKLDFFIMFSAVLMAVKAGGFWDVYMGLACLMGERDR
jgi:hypothetical protein